MPKYRGKPDRDKPDRGKSDAAHDPDRAQSEANLWNSIAPPNHYAGPPAGLIQAQDHDPFSGRWFAQYFDRTAGVRYSVGITPYKQIFVLAIGNVTRAIKWQWFNSASEFLDSDLPEPLKREPQTDPKYGVLDALGLWPHELNVLPPRELDKTLAYWRHKPKPNS